MLQDDDDDVIAMDDEPTCSTFNSNEHAYSYSTFLVMTKIYDIFKISLGQIVITHFILLFQSQKSGEKGLNRMTAVANHLACYHQTRGYVWRN